MICNYFTFAAILSYTWRLNILIKPEYDTVLSRLNLRLFIFSFLWNTSDWWEDEYKLAKMKTTNIYLNTVKVFMFQFSPYNFTAVSSNTLADTAFPVAIFRKEFAFCQCHFLCSTSSESLFASLFSVSTQVSKFNFIFFTSLIPSSISLRFTFFSFSITLSLFPYKGIVYLWCTSLQLLIKFEVLEFCF